MQQYLLYQFNEKYAPYAGVSIYSVLLNNQKAEQMCIYILGENLSEESVTKLKAMAHDFGRTMVFLDGTDQELHR